MLVLEGIELLMEPPHRLSRILLRPHLGILDLPLECQLPLMRLHLQFLHSLPELVHLPIILGLF